MKSFLFAGLFIVGCGPLNPTELQCQTDSLLVLNEAPIDCGELNYNIDLAKSILIDAHYVTESEYEEIFKTQVVHIYAINTWQVWGKTVSGRYRPESGFIEMSVSGLPMLHEMIHVIEYKRGNLATVFHTNWANNGNDKNAQAFMCNAITLNKHNYSVGTPEECRNAFTVID